MKLDHMIFVFGSNLSGIHGAGAARYAAVHKGAIFNIGEGPMGSAYALPTKGFLLAPMTLEEVQKHVKKFIAFAKEHDYMMFQITRIGTGLSGFKDTDIAQMFLDVATPDSNCFFDTAWKPMLPENTKFWGSF